jgi:hypothetical protein
VDMRGRLRNTSLNVAGVGHEITPMVAHWPSAGVGLRSDVVCAYFHSSRILFWLNEAQRNLDVFGIAMCVQVLVIE